MTLAVPEPVLKILDILENAGFEAFAVGGCVRDSLLGRKPQDWDITTSAHPEQVKKLFRRTVDTGIQHGTVTVMIGRIGYEVTTYRIDGGYSDGRHPDHVSFTPNLIEDLKRRDFTINAMAYSPAAGLMDAFDGIGDLERHLIRCVGDPKERFSEDALRILRAIRFSAQLGFSIEPETEAALAAIAPNLVHVSRERIQAELTKTLLSGHPEKMMQVRETGMDRYISPEFASVFEDTPAEVLSRHLSSAAALPEEKAVRWAAFLLESGPDPAEKILRGLRMDNDTIRDTKILAGNFHADLGLLASSDSALRAFMSSMSDGLLDRLLTMIGTLEPDRASDAEDCARRVKTIRDRGDCYRMKDLAVTGKDLINMGMKPGPELGETLNDLFQTVLQNPAENEREKLLALAQKRRK